MPHTETPPLSSPQTRVLMVLDVVESVRLMEVDEKGYITRWGRFVAEARDRILPGHRGRIRKSLGDGLMMEFADAVGAVAAGRELMGLTEGQNGPLTPSRHIRLRVAAHIVRYVSDGFDIYGRGVNLTARLMGLPAPGEMFITSALRKQLGQRDARRTQEMGTYCLRDVKRPVRVFKVL